MCMYIAPPLPKGKLPQLPRPREANHKSTRPGLTHGALGSLTSLRPFNFTSVLPFLLPRCRCHPLSTSWARCPNAGLPRHRMHRFPGNHRTTQPHPSRECRPSSRGGCAQHGVVDGGDGLLCGLGPQPGRASQRGNHPLHNAHCSGYQHTAVVRCPLPTAQSPPFVSSPSTLSLAWSLVRTDAGHVLHVVSELVPGDNARVGRVLHVLLPLPLPFLVNEIIAANTVVPVVSAVCCPVRATE